ncbi:probable DNA polymerase [Ischnura elegans]|uniref:probable DNA polymerase n=1 Tax=Ischnura elegans TaxID=197161 RepID=UPI001ED8BD98|nr:probable DNA polymerase [Ischnura elegans]
MQTRFESTENRKKMLTCAGYKVIEMWECQFEREIERDYALAKFLKEQPIHKEIPLNPRDAFYGGRTNALRLYHKACGATGEKIKYTDICSLYPYVNKYGAYPVGHPTIYVGAECPPLNDLEGVVKCDVLPPTELYHPVLPMKGNGKLLFPLCRTCALEENQGDCRHEEAERTLTGTWVTCELKKAVSLGYIIVKMHEAWSYEVTQYNRETGEGGLFAEYINAFLKLKQEASGWPSWCVTEEKKEEYLRKFREREGVDLDKISISHNPGKRSLAKLLLNSFWGKLGQRDNLTQTTVIKQSDALNSLLTDPNVDVQRLVEVNEDTIYAHWTEKEESVSPSSSSGIIMACYTTAQARLELYKYLENLQRRVLYHDTDSIIFTEKPGEWSPPIGDYLGDMTDEVAPMGPDCYISEFVSGGPKNYAYVVRSSSNSKFKKSVCKVRGITINSSNDGVVCFETLKAMLLNDEPGRTVEYSHKIARMKNHDIVSKPESKLFRIVYTKRKRLENFDTLPYGYKKRRLL